MAEVLARMKLAPGLVPKSTSIRRAHRTTVTREDAPAVHVIDGDDARVPGGNSCAQRKCSFTVSLFTRDDAGATSADALKLAVYARMAVAFAAGIVVKPGKISVEQEIADQDASRVDLDFEATYTVDGDEWAL